MCFFFVWKEEKQFETKKNIWKQPLKVFGQLLGARSTPKPVKMRNIHLNKFQTSSNQVHTGYLFSGWFFGILFDGHLNEAVHFCVVRLSQSVVRNYTRRKQSPKIWTYENNLKLLQIYFYIFIAAIECPLNPPTPHLVSLSLPNKNLYYP